MRPTSSTAIVLACCLLLSLPGTGLAQAPQRAPVAVTPHFAFYSDLETNLNDALIAAGLARRNKKPELFHSGEEALCFEKLPPSARAAWNGAVAYYAEIISPAEWNARQQFLIRMDLVGFDPEGSSVEDAEFLAIAHSFRAAATPAYRACRWTTQDALNRRWIEELRPRLARNEQKIADRLQQLYQKRWATLPILVDVVETAGWSGANSSWSVSGQGDLLISRSTGGAAAFETLFHESSHVLMDRGDPVRQALEDAAKQAGLPLPRDLWHVVLFYVTGEVVRPALSEGEPSAYTPMLYEIFDRGTWGEYRQAVENNWRPYLEGRRSLAEAAAGLIRDL